MAKRRNNEGNQSCFWAATRGTRGNIKTSGRHVTQVAPWPTITSCVQTDLRTSFVSVLIKIRISCPLLSTIDFIITIINFGDLQLNNKSNSRRFLGFTLKKGIILLFWYPTSEIKTFNIWNPLQKELEQIFDHNLKIDESQEFYKCGLNSS